VPHVGRLVANARSLLRTHWLQLRGAAAGVAGRRPLRSATSPFRNSYNRDRDIGPNGYACDPGDRITNKYTITFEKGAALPVNAFWSITLYDQEGFQVGNVLNRFAVSSLMPFSPIQMVRLILISQNESPGKELEANWLPAPKGAFNLTMRLYAPKSEALTGIGIRRRL
jgi:hypothetical protein